MNFPLFFVFQEAAIMLPAFPSAELKTSLQEAAWVTRSPALNVAVSGCTGPLLWTGKLMLLYQYC